MRSLLITQPRHRRIPSDRAILTRLKLTNLLRRQREIKNISIGDDARGSSALGQRNKSLVQTPPDQDLRLGLAVLLRQLLQRRLVPAVPAHDGAVRLHGDTALRAPVDDVSPRAPRVQFDLVDAYDAAFALAAALGLELFDVLLEFVEVVYAVVADADGAYLAGFDGFNQLRPGVLGEAKPEFEGMATAYCFPCTLAVLGATVWLVKEHQIDVFQLGKGKASVDLCPGLVVADVEDLGGEVDLIAGNSRCSNGLATAGFILVHCRRVDLCSMSDHR